MLWTNRRKRATRRIMTATRILGDDREPINLPATGKTHSQGHHLSGMGTGGVSKDRPLTIHSHPLHQAPASSEGSPGPRQPRSQPRRSPRRQKRPAGSPRPECGPRRVGAPWRPGALLRQPSPTGGKCDASNQLQRWGSRSPGDSSARSRGPRSKRVQSRGCGAGSRGPGADRDGKTPHTRISHWLFPTPLHGGFHLKSSARMAGQPCAPRRAHEPRLHCCRELSEKRPLCSHVKHLAGAWAPSSYATQRRDGHTGIQIQPSPWGAQGSLPHRRDDSTHLGLSGERLCMRHRAQRRSRRQHHHHHAYR